MKTNVSIEWDLPTDKNWLCADNIKIALSAHCKNANFKVKEIVEPSAFEKMDANKTIDKYITGMPDDDCLKGFIIKAMKDYAEQYYTHMRKRKN